MIHWNSINYDKIGFNPFINADEGDLQMHFIHSYPAKFPAFIASGAFEYAKERGIDVKRASDIFCGCGTTALESKKRGVDFWGCDINPVATLIADVKSKDYDEEKLDYYFNRIIRSTKVMMKDGEDHYPDANERLVYWFSREAYNDLYYLLESIKSEVDEVKYRNAFLCLFSSILKQSSRWLQKSIKPQIDPNKSNADIFRLFENKYTQFGNSVEELKKKNIESNCKIEIRQCSFKRKGRLPKADLIVTSPPYVTSYEYADLHQLSLLWLGCCSDYRDFRKGPVGSSYGLEKSTKKMKLNNTGTEIVDALINAHTPSSKWKSVERYYSDIEAMSKVCWRMVNDGGMAFFVIGDSELRGVRLLNSKHLIESLEKAGFGDIEMFKRIVSKGICVPYRDRSGKFTREMKACKEIYHEEYIVVGRKDAV